MKNPLLTQRLLMRSLSTIFLFVIIAFGTYEVYDLVAGTKNLAGNLTLTWGISLAVLFLVGVMAFLVVVLNIWSVRWIEPINDQLSRIRDRFGWFTWFLVLIFSLIPTKIFLYTPLGLKVSGFFARLVIFLTTAAIMAFFACRRKKQLVDFKGFLVSLLILGSVFALGKSFISVVDHPLSLTWSEGNRIWDYSIIFGRDLYNYPQDQPIEAYIDRVRQTLWGLPFLFPNVSILTVRMWSAILFTVPYALFGWMSFRFQPEGKRQWFWLGLWSFLFLNQGPIYTPLVLSAILVAGARRKSMWIALPLIFLAGYYAQSSRINWMFGAGIWATMIAMVDYNPSGNEKIGMKEWIKVMAYSLAGFMGGFGIYIGWLRLFNHLTRAAGSKLEIISTPITGSGTTFVNPNDSLEVVSEINQNTVLSNQPLIWERLLPNPTYGLGIILGLILATGPLILLLIFLIKNKTLRVNSWQKLSIFGGLSLLMGLGILISTKIGGGGDLHNLDMFFIGIIFAAALAWRSGGYIILSDIDKQPYLIKTTIVLAVAIPAFMPLVSAHPLDLPPEEKTAWTLELLQSETARIRSEGGAILFMDQRQLLTFGYLGNIPLIPEFEKKLVMDRAMSGDREYFEKFYEDIRKQRFALIITDPQRVRFSDEDEGWGAENDTWVQWVTKPLLCYYEPVYTVKKTGVWLMMPIADPMECVYP